MRGWLRRLVRPRLNHKTKMIKTLIIAALAITNAVLILTRPHINYAEDHAIIALTINRVFHEQLNGTWPQAYGSTMDQVAKFDAGIIAANNQGVTDWTQYKPN